MESQPQNPEFRINPENSHPYNTHKGNLMLHPLDSATIQVASI